MRLSRVVGVIVVAGIVAACSSDDDEPVVVEESPQPTETPTTPPPVDRWPLTGLTAPDGVADRPVLVVKVDNTAGARPQIGLADADLIVEEPVEGGSTRLAAMYHEHLPEDVAPVRSIRTTDIGIVTPTGGALVASGGAQRVLRQMDEADVTVLTEGGAGFARDPNRPSLYSLVVDLESVLEDAADLDPPELPYLEWADDGDLPAGVPATAVDIQFSHAHTTSWDWDAGAEAWLRRDELAEPDHAFTPANVLVLHVVTQDAGYTDPAGNPVDEVVFDEPGEAVLLYDGTAVNAEWQVDDADAAFVLTDEDGDRIGVPPGKTMIALVPEGGSITTS